MEEMFFCPRPECDTASLVDRFCRKCGSLLVKRPLKPATNYPCPKCGAMRFSADKFCGNCGAAPCFLFVFRHPVLVGFIVLADEEEKAWLALINYLYSGKYPYYDPTGKKQDLKSLKSEFTLIAKLEVPGLS